LIDWDSGSELILIRDCVDTDRKQRRVAGFVRPIQPLAEVPEHTEAVG
jgi:hypothetical protein